MDSLSYAWGIVLVLLSSVHSCAIVTTFCAPWYADGLFDREQVREAGSVVNLHKFRSFLESRSAFTAEGAGALCSSGSYSPT